jgi:hypothetical protein
MANRGRSSPNLSGGFTHYDEHGKKTGYSTRNLFGGGYTEYDTRGNKKGTVEPNLFGGGYTHYDEKGRKTGTTERGMFGGYVHRDSKGQKAGESDPGMFGGYNHSDGACYIATCVYGSYDCPEVWTLRRFRDLKLAKSKAGRQFIKIYYSLSPGLVARFGDKSWFVRCWKKLLDNMVGRLRTEGFEDTPYRD